MALKINFSHSQSADAKTLYIYDTTGVFDAVVNPTGWGGSNPAIGSATSDQVLIQMVGSSEVHTVQMYPTLPNTNSIPFSIDSSMLGLGPDGQIPDGQYTITRQTVVSSATYQATKRVFLISILKCCADTMLDAEPATGGCGCGCSGNGFTNATILRYSIFTLNKAFRSLKFEKADQIFRYAQGLCKQKNCKNC